MLNDKRKAEERQEKSRQLEAHLVEMLWLLLLRLKENLDRRVVNTLLGVVMVIVMHRHRNNGLLLSELGSYLLGAGGSRAGTKRISTLVHSERWEAKFIEEYFWQALNRWKRCGTKDNVHW